MTDPRPSNPGTSNADLHRQVLDTAQVLIIGLDTSGTIVEFNPFAETLTGVSQTDAIGSNWFDRFIPARHRESLRKGFDSYRATGQPTRFTSHVIGKDQATHTVEWSNSRILDDEGNSLVIVSCGLDVTDSRSAKAEVDRSHRELADLKLALDESSIVAVTDAKGKITYANSKFCEISGYSYGELIGKDHRLLNSDYHPKSFFQGLWSVIRSGNVWKGEIRNRSKDGGVYWVDTTIVPYLDENGKPFQFIAIRNEVTERKLAEEALAKEKEQLSVTLRSITDGVITTDITGRIVLVNQAAERMTGWKQAKVIGRPLKEVFRLLQLGSDQPAADPVGRGLSGTTYIQPSRRLTLVSRNGASIPIEENSAVIRDRESKVRGVVIVFRDITTQRNAEAEMLRSSKLESLGILAGGLAHDFNNILATILMNLSIAKMDLESGTETFTILADAETACRRARDLTQQLLTFARGGAPVKKVCSIRNLVEEQIAFALRGTGIKTDLILPKDIFNVEMDEAQITQVVHNLAINAQQAMPEGGTFRVILDNIDVRANEHPPLTTGRWVHLTFTDEGCGMDSETLRKIFDPYFTTKKTGSGLGLASAYSIVRNHNGHITAESLIDQGTTFHIYLPATDDRPVEIDAAETLTPEGAARILIMDDEETFRSATRRILERLGYAVVEAGDGAEAVEAFIAGRENGQPVDALIMDLTIPGGMGGRDAIQQLLTIDPEVKALVASGYSNDPILGNFGDYGFKGVVVKPFEISELAQTLKLILNP